MKGLKERDWDSLLRRIKDGNCTPFLGAGACAGFIPLGSEIAQEWARDYYYPLSDPWDLARVAQCLAIKHDPMFPKDEIMKRFRTVVPPDFDAPGEPHGVLADLPLPIYMTTNYDDFMTRALRSRHRNPSREMCRWNSLVRDQPSVFDPGSGVEVSVANPVVFHLHGHDKVPESLVLTEDDYLDFLVNISRDPQIIPRRIEKALASTSLLFIGYRLADWNFRVLFRGLIGSLERSLGRIRIAVQLTPEPPEAGGITQEQVQQYLEDYLAKDDVRVYWGEACDFAKELQGRWEAFNEANRAEG
jgi:hypothetical protein